MAKQIGYGSVIAVATSTGGAGVNIGQVRSIDGPNLSANDVDTTTLDSSSNFRTFIQGLTDPGVVTLEVVLDSTLASGQYPRLVRANQNREQVNFEVYYGSSTGDGFTFNGYVQGIGPQIPLDDLITAEISIKASGDPGFTT